MSAALDASASAARIDRLREALGALELDALVVDSAYDLRYLSGFTGSNGLALIGGPDRGPNRFLTDFRYTIQSTGEVLGPFERETVTGELRDSVGGLLDGAGGRLGFDESKMTVRDHRRLAEQLPGGWELVACSALVSQLRTIKEPAEVALIEAACQLADAALGEVLEDGLVGRTERQVALALETAMRRLGAEAPSFSSIVAAAQHGAMPHAQPGDEPIPPNVLVTIDWGALHQGYCSDCTRTYATGEALPELAREIYELVLAAQLKGLEAVTAGPNGREVDAVARRVIDQAGQGERFGHGLGHGVGLEIHEGPRLSRTAGEEPLLEGNVVTVEPGVYLPEVLGVRIEDLVVVRAEGRDVLTRLSKELTVIS